MRRWVKFEEDIEEGGNRWSKPHVASPSPSTHELTHSLNHSLIHSITHSFTQALTRSLTVVCRWVKFEEDVEEGGNRWSKPHVATLSLYLLALSFTHSITHSFTHCCVQVGEV